MSVRNQGKSRTFLANGDLSAKRYHVVYQSSATQVTIASTTHNSGEYNLFILQNAPTSGQEASCIEVGTGNSYLAVADATASIGDELMIDSAGKGTAKVGTNVKAIARVRSAVTGAGDIVEVDTLNHAIAESSDQPASITFSAAAGGANVCEVTISLKNSAGTVITTNRNFTVWLSDAATGLGITGTGASDTVTAKTGEGTVLSALTAKKHLAVQTKASTGTFVLEITDTAKTAFYVCAELPATGQIFVSDVLETADYGS